MGFRFRKSVNLGGFRINLSKSGIGYSVGAKGFRVTKTARNTLRTTASAYGTGLSYVEEHSLNKKNNQSEVDSNKNNPEYAESANFIGAENFENNISNLSVSDGLAEILKQAKKSLILFRVTTFCLNTTAILMIFLPILIPLVLVLGIIDLWIVKRKKISLDYNIAPDLKQVLVDRFFPIIKASLSQCLWNVDQSFTVKDKKYSSGATSSIKRSECKVLNKVPFPFNTDSVVAAFKSKTETFIFMPDALFVMKGMKIGAFSYSDINIDYHSTLLIESEKVPQDTTIKGITWKYVNADGTPDRRFSNNPQYPKCLYGEIAITSPLGLNTVFQFSRE